MSRRCNSATRIFHDRRVISYGIKLAICCLLVVTPLHGHEAVADTSVKDIEDSHASFLVSNGIGTIRLFSYGGDTSPFLRVRTVNLTLWDRRDEDVFVRIANRHGKISRALIKERGNPYEFLLGGVTVKGYAVSPPCCKDGRAHIALGVSNWTPIRLATPVP